jgi:TonB family protein
MSLRTALLFTALAWAASPPGALAQWRCDCTTIIASCTAEVAARENWIDVTTDSQQCARVDYFVDGQPFVTTVVEGQHRLDWMSPRQNPNILVQSCQVCADNATDGSAAAIRRADSAADAADGPLEPLIRWSAEYPTQAQQRGIEGHVTVAFDVTAEGGVENAEVVESEPAGVFDNAALAAVRRWRYAPEPERAATRLTDRIEFSLGEMIWQLRPGATPPQADAATSLPRNQCIREDAVYNFGEMVEAGLINACSDPLVVYGCAVGTGRQAGRWVCNDSERAGQLLVRPGDERIGATVQQGEQLGQVQWLTYADSFFVARAPNSQYWWIACAQTDSACRDDARMWVRSVDRQPSSVDPRGRATVAVAGSY